MSLGWSIGRWRRLHEALMLFGLVAIPYAYIHVSRDDFLYCLQAFGFGTAAVMQVVGFFARHLRVEDDVESSP